GGDALLVAAAGGHAEVAGVLLARGADANSVTDDKRTPLHEAAAGRQQKVVESLLKHGAKGDACDDWGRTAFHEAARSGARGIVEVLVKHGATIDTGDSQGLTPVGWAVLSSKRDVAEVLAARGARLGYLECLALGKVEAVRAFLKTDPQLARGQLAGKPPLYWALESGNRAVVDLLLAYKASPNTKTDLAPGNADTPLNAAARMGRADLVELL